MCARALSCVWTGMQGHGRSLRTYVVEMLATGHVDGEGRNEILHKYIEEHQVCRVYL